MIITKLMGGLGNQMFQYAAGRRLACLHGVHLKLDLSSLGNEEPGITPRSYALAPFSINADPATDEEIARLYQPVAGRRGRFFNWINPRYRKTYIRSRNFPFDPAILRLPDNVSLDGYWQSEKYFEDIAALIRSDFTVRAEPEGLNREIASLVGGDNAASIHVRRGDYVTDAKTAAKHGTCTNNYFMRAVELVAARVDRPHFFVFSDDPAWVGDHFRIPYPMTVVDHNGPDQAHEDLRLMSQCRNLIIANSSFSWWAAWLNPRPDKTVIAPARWFADSSIDTSDLIPGTWKRISA